MLCHILFANESQDMEQEELLDVQAGVISLLTEMELPHPLERYAEKLIQLEEDCAYAEEAAEALGDAGRRRREILLKAYPASRGYGRKCFIDLLSSLSPSDDIREILLDEFAKPDADRRFLQNAWAAMATRRRFPYCGGPWRSRNWNTMYFWS